MKDDCLFPVPPTAVWIMKKEQHLLAGNEVVFSCASTGASPRTKFTWFLGEDMITTTSTKDTKLHQVSSQIPKYSTLKKLHKCTLFANHELFMKKVESFTRSILLPWEVKLDKSVDLERHFLT